MQRDKIENHNIAAAMSWPSFKITVHQMTKNLPKSAQQNQIM